MIRTLKEIARHVLHSAGIDRGKNHLAGDRAERFSTIYRTGVWKLGDPAMPGSGTGSTLLATESLRSALPGLLRELEVGTLLDIGCGDFTWMQSVDLPCDYVGIDIVPSVIEDNRANHARADRRFEVIDAVEGIEGIKADAILCREVLFHLSFADAKKLLANSLATGCQHFLLTSDPITSFNADIRSGDFRAVNLQRRPFSLPGPQRRIDDSQQMSGRFIGLWSASDIRKLVG